MIQSGTELINSSSKNKNYNNRRIKIGFLSVFNPNDRKAASGTNFKMAEQLSKIGDVKWIHIKQTFVGRILRRFFLLMSQTIPLNINFPITKIGTKICYPSLFGKSLDDYDIIVAFFCVHVLYKYQTKTPIIYFSDATFPVLLNYYKHYSNILVFLQNQALDLECAGLSKITKAVFSSEWAKQGAKSLGVPDDKLAVIELGANINDNDIACVSDKPRLDNDVVLLFIGVDWERKGGQIAVDAVTWLNENGVKSKLHIIGVNPPNNLSNDKNICCHGFKNKNNPKEYQYLVEIIRQSDIFLLPTVAECAGIVFAEASAYGLPILTHDTGGIGNYVVNDVNGYRLPLGSTGMDFGKKIKSIIESGDIERLSLGGKKLYQEKLNWDIWKNKVENIIKEILQDKNQ